MTVNDVTIGERGYLERHGCFTWTSRNVVQLNLVWKTQQVHHLRSYIDRKYNIVVLALSGII